MRDLAEAAKRLMNAHPAELVTIASHDPDMIRDVATAFYQNTVGKVAYHVEMLPDEMSYVLKKS
jgi:TusA-related sulfurtransferase